MKKLKKGLINKTICVLIGFVLGGVISNPSSATAQNDNKVKVSKVINCKNDMIDIDGFYLEKGDTLVKLNDGSFALCNKSQNLYLFQPVELGDWNYKVDNEQELENIIKTYLSIKNN